MIKPTVLCRYTQSYQMYVPYRSKESFWNPSICMHVFDVFAFMSAMLPRVLQGTQMLDLESKNRKVRRLSRLLQAQAHPLQRLAHLHPSPWVSMAIVCLDILLGISSILSGHCRAHLPIQNMTSWNWKHRKFDLCFGPGLIL